MVEPVGDRFECEGRLGFSQCSAECMVLLEDIQKFEDFALDSICHLQQLRQQKNGTGKKPSAEATAVGEDSPWAEIFPRTLPEVGNPYIHTQLFSFRC